MLNIHHQAILKLIEVNAGEPTQHTFLDGYLGNTHPRYPINVPTLRKLGRDWMKEHKDPSVADFVALLSSLAEGKSSTEKCMVGILLDYSTPLQRKFNPKVFDTWMNHLEGWAEVDSVCTGKYTTTEIPSNWNVWKDLLVKFSKSKNINKRRASLVLLCSPLRNVADIKLAEVALQNIERLKNDKNILITKAISWVLRTMEKHYRDLLVDYMNENKESLPKIAVRETLIKLNTGVKTKRKTKK